MDPIASTKLDLVKQRVWFYRGPVSGAITVKSARVAGGRLTGWIFDTQGGAAGYSFRAARSGCYRTGGWGRRGTSPALRHRRPRLVRR